MRVLVVGSYPPMPGPSARRALAAVGRLCASGHDVEVLSPRPSAAHHHRPLAGLGAAVALARRARSYDHLVLRLEPGLPLRRRLAAVDGAALVAALAPWRRVTLEVDDLAGLPLAPGGRLARALWRRAATVVVADDGDRRRLRAEAGPAAGRVEVAPPPPPPVAAPPAGATAAAAGPGASPRLALMTRVRAASAASKAVPGAWPPPPVPDPGPPPPPPPTTAAGWAAWLVKKAVRTALGRHADTVLGPVFRLRLAVRERRAPPPPGA